MSKGPWLTPDERRRRNVERVAKWQKENPEKVREYARRKRDRKSPSKRAEESRRLNERRAQEGYWLKRRYGITKEQYDELYEEQEGRCAICSSDGKLCVDHDHETGRVRGLLCTPCNTAIGKLKEDPKLFEKALHYLAKPRTTP